MAVGAQKALTNPIHPNLGIGELLLSLAALEEIQQQLPETCIMRVPSPLVMECLRLMATK